MSQRDNILQELRELQSSLAELAVQNSYQVPHGYFEGLADQVMRRIKAMDADTAGEELGHLSPLVNSISRKMPYSVPADFFSELDQKIVENIRDGQLNPAEELAELSPLLSGLKKEMPYSVPADYFEQLEVMGKAASGKPAAKVVSITKRQWFRYAAAAVVTGFVVLSGFLIFKSNSIDPNKNPSEWVAKNLKKVNTETIEEFTELAEQGAVASIDTKNEMREVNEIKELIKDIPDEEIQKFLDETQIEEIDVNDDIMMN